MTSAFFHSIGTSDSKLEWSKPRPKMFHLDVATWQNSGLLGIVVMGTASKKAVKGSGHVLGYRVKTVHWGWQSKKLEEISALVELGGVISICRGERANKDSKNQRHLLKWKESTSCDSPQMSLKKNRHYNYIHTRIPFLSSNYVLWSHLFRIQLIGPGNHWSLSLCYYERKEFSKQICCINERCLTTHKDKLFLSLLIAPFEN